MTKPAADPAFSCPACGQRCSGVVFNTRELDGYRWRRRRCELCGRRFSTVEIVIPPGVESEEPPGRGGPRVPATKPKEIIWR